MVLYCVLLLVGAANSASVVVLIPVLGCGSCQVTTATPLMFMVRCIVLSSYSSKSPSFVVLPTDPQLSVGELKGHTDAVWDFAIHPTSGLLLSCASDCTCCLWNHQVSNPQLKVYQAETSQLLNVSSCVPVGVGSFFFFWGGGSCC